MYWAMTERFRERGTRRPRAAATCLPGCAGRRARPARPRRRGPTRTGRPSRARPAGRARRTGSRASRESPAWAITYEQRRAGRERAEEHSGARPGGRRVARPRRPCYLALMKAKDRLKAAQEEWRRTDLAKAAEKSALRRAGFQTDSGIPIPDLLTPGRRRRPERRGRREVPARPRVPRPVPVHARRAADDVPRPAVDHAPVRRLRHAGGHQPALQVPARARHDRPLHRLRYAGADGLRRRPPDDAAARSARKASRSPR